MNLRGCLYTRSGWNFWKHTRDCKKPIIRTEIPLNRNLCPVGIRKGYSRKHKFKELDVSLVGLLPNWVHYETSPSLSFPFPNLSHTNPTH